MECNFMKANEIDLFLLPQPLTVNSTPAPISHIYYTHTYTHLLSCSWSRQKYKLCSAQNSSAAGKLEYHPTQIREITYQK